MKDSRSKSPLICWRPVSKGYWDWHRPKQKGRTWQSISILPLTITLSDKSGRSGRINRERIWGYHMRRVWPEEQDQEGIYLGHATLRELPDATESALITV